MEERPRKESTQERHPRRAMARSLIAAIVGFIPLIPEIVRAYGLDSIPWIATAAALCATTARIMVMPPVVKWCETYVPWIAPSGYDGLHRKDLGQDGNLDDQD
ncbi:hypothetical protein GP475_09665 [Corynebacterium poyangense]|uniref:Uncharacterized protein n=1 Tax=Corynebacterium poyangense TaxID=2684405 RepID=A0A7H0SQQ1_9CORY|nr:hypothetical protein [Corynebacterium poyangense]QNQ90876.1 hypothetical protein GP475_09665 [Corynebacterium poyangense]